MGSFSGLPFVIWRKKGHKSRSEMSVKVGGWKATRQIGPPRAGVGGRQPPPSAEQTGPAALSSPLLSATRDSFNNRSKNRRSRSLARRRRRRQRRRTRGGVLDVRSVRVHPSYPHTRTHAAATTPTRSQTESWVGAEQRATEKFIPRPKKHGRRGGAAASLLVEGD